MRVVVSRLSGFTIMTASLFVAAVACLPAPAAAQGFNTCTIPQKELTWRLGVERPSAPAYDAVCVAVLEPTCRDYAVDHKPCAYRECLLMPTVKTCPNGDLAAYHAPTITPYVATTVRPFTAAELAEMNRAIDAEARKLAAKWTDNGRVPLAPGAMIALQNMSCQMAAFGNPDVRCVPR